MNVFHRFTRESLIRNRSRTLVTIVGIILSVALLTAVTEGAYSGVQFLRRSVEQRVGSFFGYFDNLTEGEASQLTQSHEVTKSTTWQDIGWAAIGSSNDYKPYLHVVSVDADFRSLVAVNLTSGRMPEKAGEILLPDHLLTNGDVSIPVGETITLDVGRRVYDGDTLDADISFAEGETLENTRPRTYTVVGTYARFDYLIEDFGCPGYTALTCTENGGSVRLFARTASAAKFPAFLAAQSAVADDYRVNSELMNCYGVTGYANINSVIYGMAGVLLFLIAFGSISLIYNSFSISVSERTRQFGILKSVGATKKQIRAARRAHRPHPRHPPVGGHRRPRARCAHLAPLSEVLRLRGNARGEELRPQPQALPRDDHGPVSERDALHLRIVLLRVSEGCCRQCLRQRRRAGGYLLQPEGRGRGKGAEPV